MTTMRISKTGIDLIKKYEGCRLTAYKCPAGVWTIGYGHTAGVKQGMTISQAQADAFLVEDLVKYERKVNKYSKYNFNQAQFDALVSFAYNVGSIDGLTKNGTRTIQQISDAITLYNKGGGKVLPGLVRRRAEEKALFNSKNVQKTEQKNNTNSIKTYTVVKGDNLTKIAKKFGTTVNKLKTINNIKNANLIKVGQVLRIE